MKALLGFAWLIVVCAAGPSPLCAQSDSGRSFLDGEAILAAWESTYTSIRTMRVSYSNVLVDYRPATNDPNRPLPAKHWHIERIEEGKRYHLRYSNAEDGFDREDSGLYRDKSYFEQAFNGKTTQAYWGSDKHGSIVTGLTDRFADTENRLKENMFLTIEPGGKVLGEAYPNGLPALSWTFRRRIIGGGIAVRPDLERVAGELCHVVELVRLGVDQTGPKQIKEVFWMAHDKGMCVMKYKWFWDDKIDCEIDVEEIAVAQMDGARVWYPKRSYKTSYWDHGEVLKYELTVKEFVPNIEVDDSTFRFDFPPGTNVLDRVLGLTYVVAGAELAGEVLPVRADEPPDKTQPMEETADDTPVSTESAPKEEAGRQGMMPFETEADNNKILGMKTFSIVGVIVLAAFGLVLWYKRSVNAQKERESA